MYGASVMERVSFVMKDGKVMVNTLGLRPPVASIFDKETAT
jgi:hypothetical protein